MIESASLLSEIKYETIPGSKYKTIPGNKYETIQVLRFIAALMVMILHSTFYTSERLDSNTIVYNAGFNGVKLFFIISGFVMIMSSENLNENSRGWIIFGVKRIIRIVPIYWIITSYKIIVLIFASFLIYHARLDIGFILKSYFFIPAINKDGMFHPFYGVGWTLNFEMFFYLLFTISLALKIRPILFLSIILIFLSVISIFKTSNWPDVSFYANPIILNFLYGMIGAKLILYGIKLPQRLAIPLILISLFIIFCPITGIFTSLSFLLYNEIVISIATFLVVYGAASIDGYWNKKIPSIFIFLGAASYSLYLIHPSVAPSAPTLIKLFHSKMIFLSVTLGVIGSILVAVVFYRFCEKPLTKFLTKLAQKSNLI